MRAFTILLIKTLFFLSITSSFAHTLSSQEEQAKDFYLQLKRAKFFYRGLDTSSPEQLQQHSHKACFVMGHIQGMEVSILSQLGPFLTTVSESPAKRELKKSLSDFNNQLPRLSNGCEELQQHQAEKTLLIIKENISGLTQIIDRLWALIEYQWPIP